MYYQPLIIRGVIRGAKRRSKLCETRTNAPAGRVMYIPKHMQAQRVSTAVTARQPGGAACASMRNSGGGHEPIGLAASCLEQACGHAFSMPSGRIPWVAHAAARNHVCAEHKGQHDLKRHVTCSFVLVSASS
jgi:hypothetical protein